MLTPFRTHKFLAGTSLECRRHWIHILDFFFFFSFLSMTYNKAGFPIIRQK